MSLPFPQSIRGKVTLATAIVTAIAMLAVVGITAYATQWVLKNTIATSMSDRLDRAQAAVEEGDYELALDISGSELMQIIDANGNVLASTTKSKKLAPLTGIDRDDDEFELDDLEFEVDDDDDDERTAARVGAAGSAGATGASTAASASGGASGAGGTGSASGGSASGASGGAATGSTGGSGGGGGSASRDTDDYDDDPDDDNDDSDDYDDDYAPAPSNATYSGSDDDSDDYDDTDDNDDYDDDYVAANPANASYDSDDDDDDYDEDDEESTKANAQASYSSADEDDEDDDDDGDDDDARRVGAPAPVRFTQAAWAADSSSSSASTANAAGTASAANSASAAGTASSANAATTSSTAGADSAKATTSASSASSTKATASAPSTGSATATSTESPTTGTAYVDASDILGDAGPYLVMRRGVTSPDGPVTLAAVTSLAPAVRAGYVAAQLLLGVMLLVLLFVVVFTWHMTARTLRPVEQMRATAENINAKDLSARIPVPEGDADLSRLATTFNDMLARVESSFNDQKRFISDASHELKSPVAATGVMIEALQTHPDSVDPQQVLDDLESENKRMGNIVGDLLHLARSDEGRMTVTKRPIDLMDLLFEEATSLRSRSSIEVDTSDVNPVVCEADPDRMSHVVRNLMDNAARYAKTKVKVSCAEVDGEVIILVSDDGPGIPEEDRARVFDRFVRLDENRSKKQGGTGLGLSVVRSMVEAHGGHVGFGTPEIGGATAVISIPTR